jgi:hypothetical protein
MGTFFKLHACTWVLAANDEIRSCNKRSSSRSLPSLPRQDESIEKLPNRFFRSESNLPVRHLQLHTAATCNYRIKSCGSLESLKDWTSDVKGASWFRVASWRLPQSAMPRLVSLQPILTNISWHVLRRLQVELCEIVWHVSILSSKLQHLRLLNDPKPRSTRSEMRAGRLLSSCQSNGNS